MPVAQDDIVRVTARMQGTRGQEIVNVFQLRNNGLGPVVDSLVGDDLGPWLEDIYSELLEFMPAVQEFVAIDMHNITQNYTIPSIAWPTLTVGGASTVSVPAGAAALLTLPTGILNVRGRKFFGQMSEGANTGDAWDADVLTALLNIGDLMMGSFVGAVSANFWLPGVIDSHGDFWAFEQAIASANPAYQRRRRFGTGR